MISVAALLAEVPGLEDDGTLADLIVRATAFVQSLTRRYFGTPADLTLWKYGKDSVHLFLPEPPTTDDEYTEPEIVEERDYPGQAEPTLLALGTDYSIRPYGTIAVLIRHDRETWRSTREYTLEYVRGYEVNTGPGDVRQLVIDLCRVKLDARNQGDLKSESIGGYSYTRFEAADLDSIGGAWETIRAWKAPVYA